MNEQQFLELSDRERDAYIEDVVFKRVACDKWEERNLGSAGGPIFYNDGCEHKPDGCYPTSEVEIIHGLIGGPGEYHAWQGLGKGVEHCNANGYFLEFTQWYDGSWDAYIFREGRDELIETRNKNIFLAFWIAYLKALGVLE